MLVIRNEKKIGRLTVFNLEGLFVCQDGFNDASGTSGTQSFRFTPLHLVDGVS